MHPVFMAHKIFSRCQYDSKLSSLMNDYQNVFIVMFLQPCTLLTIYGAPMFPSVDEWIKKIQLIHKGKHWSAMKKERGMI